MKEDTCCVGWDDIKVPAHIQIWRIYDVPQYANVQYPWEAMRTSIRARSRSSLTRWQAMSNIFTVKQMQKRLFVSFRAPESGLGNLVKRRIHRTQQQFVYSV